MLDGLSRIRPGRSRRISSFDRTGGNRDYFSIAPGETLVLAEIDGPGVIRHIWNTIYCPGDELYGRNLVIRAYWDGASEPAIECPLGDFFGQGWGMAYPLTTLAFAAAPDGGRSRSCWMPMPFRRHARIEVENQSQAEVERFYYYLDWDSCPDLDPAEGFLHAIYHQELTQPEGPDGDRENEWEALGPYAGDPSVKNHYVWCNVDGPGHFAGVHHYVNCPTPMWYGEGDDVFLIDGEAWPGLHGTGTEDYFNTAWSPNEVIQHPFFGIARVPEAKMGWMGRTHLYRFHHSDPIRFERSLWAGIEHGHANCLTLEIASVAFLYLASAGSSRAALPSLAERIPRPEIGVVDVHRWRDEWRKLQ